MKSRKFKAVLAAVSAIAVLATAMTGFAAAKITTETKYNLTDTKAEVTTKVSDLSTDDAQVTLLVKTADDFGVNSSGIAYIDQKAASSGEAVFTYQLNKDTLGATDAVVITSGNDSNDGTLSLNTNALGVNALANVDEDAYTITYGDNAFGVKDTEVSATIVAKDGYVIKDIKINNVSVGADNATLTINPNTDTITVEFDEEEKTPALNGVYQYVSTSDGIVSTSTLMQVVGSPTEVGVKYGAYEYPASRTNNEVFVAVTLRAKEDNNITASAIKAYCKTAEGTTEYTPTISNSSSSSGSQE